MTGFRNQTGFGIRVRDPLAAKFRTQRPFDVRRTFPNRRDRWRLLVGVDALHFLDTLFNPSFDALLDDGIFSKKSSAAATPRDARYSLGGEWAAGFRRMDRPGDRP